MSRRRGFTLVELLVVIAIIGVLVAILLPAVQSARESARKVTCANNMKQVGLAVLQHSAANRDMLPGLWRTFRLKDGRPSTGEGGHSPQSFGWRSTLLPYLEEQNLFDQIDFSQGAGGLDLQPVLLTVLPVFQCPSTPGYPRIVHPTGNLKVVLGGAYDYNVSHARVPHTPHNCRLTAFDGMPSQMLRDDGQVDLPSWKKAYERIRQYHGDPIGMRYGPARLRWVTDGLTQTTMLLEQAFWPGQANRRDKAIGTLGGWNWANPPYRLELLGNSFRAINQNNWDGRFAFHPSGAHNVMLDGSVSFLGEDTNVLVLRAIDTRDNGEVISDSDWR